MTIIEKAKESDLIKVAETYDIHIKHEMETESYTNWVLGLYPTIETAKKAYERGDLYVLRCDDRVVGSMIVNGVQLDDYRKIEWEYKAPDDQVIVVHTLCIIPEYAGKGLGSKMIEYAASLGLSTGCTVMRLDTYAGNYPAQKFYNKLGFRISGVLPVLFQGVIPEDLMFLEKKLI